MDRIIHAEVWATDTIPADLPPMIAFKEKADKIIKERYGLQVEHTFAIAGGVKQTYERYFYDTINDGRNSGRIYGFPYTLGAWCNTRLKTSALSRIGKINIREDVLSHTEATQERSGGGAIHAQRPDGIPRSEDAMVQLIPENESTTIYGFPVSVGRGNWCTGLKQGFSKSPDAQGAKKNIVQYLGIASDEPKRIKKHSVPGKILPLVDIGWDEAYCRKWCEENDLLSPIYTTATRGGCWFCHNQGVDQLRLLRKDYPDLWALLLKWDKDSPTTFKPDGHTVHDFEVRFEAEDAGIIKPGDKKFRWNKVLTQ